MVSFFRGERDTLPFELRIDISTVIWYVFKLDVII
jgi:hypothetical protein